MRNAAVCLLPAFVVASNWLRLEHPEHDVGRTFALVALALLPSVAPRLWQRLALLAVALVVAADVATRWSLDHPRRLAEHVVPAAWNGLLDFYDVKLPFDPAFHPNMHLVLVTAAFAFAAAMGLAAASRGPLGSVLVLVVGAGWPATLLTDGRDLLRGAAILAAALVLLAGLRRDAGRTALRAAVAGGAIVALALTAATQPAVAKSEFLHWEDWDLYTRPAHPVSVQRVWGSSYTGFSWPRKITTVFKVKAPARSLYWRSTTLDLFDGGRWREALVSTRTSTFAGRIDLTQGDALAVPGEEDPARWTRADVEIAALADNHLPAPSVPVAYSAGYGGFAQGGIALSDFGLERGIDYTAWSWSPAATPAQLARSRPDYPLAVLPYLELLPRVTTPAAFGTPGRDAALRVFLAQHPSGRVFYDTARRVVGDARSPYAAALALESWFRSTGGFTYSQHPPRSAWTLAGFLKTRVGYCQHFAGAMTLMLRYLGVPARVAAGFTSGTYDSRTHTWTVVDRDAHMWVEVWFARYGWLPFDPTPGVGSLSGAYSVSSPQFKVSSAAGIVRGVAASLFNTAAIHQQNSFGDKSPGTSFAGTDIRHPKSGIRAVAAHRGGSLGKLLAVVLLCALVLIALAKAARRHVRYATVDPRRQAAACRADLRDFLADQRIAVVASVAPDELAEALRRELEVDAVPFAHALAAARFGPPADAHAAAARARGELARLRAQIRSRLGYVRRARGFVSLRSLGLA
jgi:transglutaminase-like putative cysteine protease